tara:strand:- start:528 stop:1340 length:813 start_codon:yes stop_codon:yes gene_type:complete
MKIKFATWNLNSIKSRLIHLLEWLEEESPDVVFLQELKANSDEIPFLELGSMGYNIEFSVESSKNGVAILSKAPLNIVSTELPERDGTVKDKEARILEVNTSLNDKPITLICVYVPAGGYGPVGNLNPASKDKFPYKVDFLRRLYRKLRDSEGSLIIAGDFNIAPQITDIYSNKIDGEVCSSQKERDIFSAILDLGLFNSTDAYPDLSKDRFTWWSYKGTSFYFNKGLSLDHILVSNDLKEGISGGRVCKELREKENPSDHAPLLITIDI